MNPLLRPTLGLLVALVLASGCASGPADPQTDSEVPLRFDRREPERLVRSYLGGYGGGAAGADPFASGLVSGSGDDLVLHPQKLDAAARAALRDANGDGAIDWDEFKAFAEATYYAARAFPPTLDGLRAEAPYAADSPDWFAVETDGVMTTARRRVLVPLAALRSAMEASADGGDLRYPDGTWFIGEHLVDGQVVETTVKRRRADGFWDFAVYGADGALAPATATEPKPLRAPTQCTGCHLGQKLFEPEKSFPAEATDGPHGPRAVYVPDAWRRADAVARFEEHARRADGVLGLYATLYAGRLIAAREAGTLGADDAAWLERLGL
jgi:hypothetical protein